MSDPWLRRDWIAPGMTLIEQGGKTGQLYVLKDGQFEVLRDGKHVSTIKTPGAVLGEMSVLLDVPQSATVRAITEVDFLRHRQCHRGAAEPSGLASADRAAPGTTRQHHNGAAHP